MQVDIYHPVRVRMLEMAQDYITQLKTSDDIAIKEVAIKEDILNHPAIREFTHSL